MRARSPKFPFFPLRQAGALLCALLVAGGALELHNLANHHRAIEVGARFDPAAAHPGSPHHFDHSEEVREPDCATCTLQAQARGVRPNASSPIASSSFLAVLRPADLAPALSARISSASPRGPPAA